MDLDMPLSYYPKANSRRPSTGGPGSYNPHLSKDFIT